MRASRDLDVGRGEEIGATVSHESKVSTQRPTSAARGQHVPPPWSRRIRIFNNILVASGRPMATATRSETAPFVPVDRERAVLALCQCERRRQRLVQIAPIEQAGHAVDSC